MTNAHRHDTASDADPQGHAAFDDAAPRGGALTAVARKIAERTDPDYVILFGSQARNDAGDVSDIDVMVVKETDDLHALARKAEEAVCDVDARVDVVPTTTTQLARCETAASAVYEDAMREGRVLFSRERGLEAGERRGADAIAKTSIDRTTRMAWTKRNLKEQAEGALAKAADRMTDLRAAGPRMTTTGYLMIALQAVEQSLKAVQAARGERQRAGHFIHQQARRLEEAGEILPEGIKNDELKAIAEGGNQDRYSEWMREEEITKRRAGEIAQSIYEYSRRRTRELLARDGTDPS